MPLYDHFQKAKNAENLPQADDMGMCLNCSYFDAEGELPLSDKEQLAHCAQPQLLPYALIVSGTSACNKWKEREKVDPEAKKYSNLHEK